MKKLRYILISIASLIIISLSSCGDDDDSRSDLEVINDWIYANMEYWYFWTADLVNKPATNENPEVFFRSLLDPRDRFSFIYDDYRELIDRLNGVTLESGFEFQLFLEDPNSSGVIMQLSYIKEDSPADLLGLKRGDNIYAINDTQMDTLNFRDLLSQINDPYAASYRRYNFESETFEDQGTVNIIPVTFAEDPILLDTIYNIEGRKIGYFVYTFFSPGPTESSNTYDADMMLAFANFKNEGIQDLIVDLRFNSGGSETSAANLTSLIVSGASEGDLMFRKSYNEQVEDFIINDDELGEDFLNVTFREFNANVGDQISGRVHIITSERTASASEVVINSLLPYMDVFIIGDTTVGKDAGSVTLFDEDSDINNWAIQPIVVKLVNQQGNDYPDGFAPQVPILDRFEFLKPLGDVEEPLLGVALAAIGVQPARIILQRDDAHPKSKSLYSSLDKKAYSGKFLIRQ